MKTITQCFTILTLLFSCTLPASELVSEAQIRSVMAATDAAATKRDVERLGQYLSENFARYIELPMDKWDAAFRLDKDKYLDMVRRGWQVADDYSYERTDTVVYLSSDRLGGKSNSTVTEITVVNGKKFISKFREYASYAMENGRLVITTIEGHKLVGDTTPEPMLFSKQQAQKN